MQNKGVSSACFEPGDFEIEPLTPGAYITVKHTIRNIIRPGSLIPPAWRWLILMSGLIINVCSREVVDINRSGEGILGGHGKFFKWMKFANKRIAVVD